MSIKSEVVQREAQTAQVVQAEKPKNAAQMMKEAIQAQTKAFALVLPKSVDEDRFSRLVLTAIKSNGQLMECWATEQGQTSVFLAAMQAAALGLEPNTPTQECWLLPRRNKQIMECQLSIGWRGFAKLTRNSPNTKTVFADVVREGDHFKYARGAEADIFEHIPEADDDAPITHAYAVIRYMNGGYNYVVMTRKMVEKHRAMSDSWKSENARAYSPWTKWESAMFAKTAFRKLVPYMDLSPELASALAQDDHAVVLSEDNSLMPGADYEFPAALMSPEAAEIQPQPVASETTAQVEADPATGEIRESAQDLSGGGQSSSTDGAGTESPDEEAQLSESPTGQNLSAVQELKMLMRKQEILGEERLKAIERTAGVKVKSFDVLDDDTAEQVIAQLLIEAQSPS